MSIILFKSIKSRLIWALILVLFFFSLTTAAEKTDWVDEIFAKWDSTSSPGAALAVIKDGQIIYERGYGMANLEHNIPITPTTVFRIGSTSKQFTATCIAILSLQGKISLDDDIRKYIPEMPRYEKTITIRNLVHHTSGIRDYCSLLSFAGYVSYLDHPTIEETIEIIASQKNLNFLPGEKYLYSNSGYFLLGIILKRVSGQTLNQFAQEHIFKPLGMKNTHFHSDLTRIVKNRADGYSPTKNGFRINMSTFDQVGDGGLYTTVQDLYLWDQAFYNHKLGKDLMDLVQTVGKLKNGKKLDYAFGLGISEYRGLKTVSHGGGWVGFRAGFTRFPEQEFSVVCLANMSSINPSSLCQKVADIYLSDHFTEEPQEKKEEKIVAPVKLSEEELKEKAGHYYDEQAGRWIIISAKEDKLETALRGQSFLLIPVSKTTFKALDAPYDITFKFSLSAEGKPQAKLIMGGEEGAILEKAPPISPLTQKELREYVGKYYSDELLTTYQILNKEETLMAKNRYEPMELEHMAPDRFTVEGMNLDFTRNKANEITGFSLSLGRARNIHFHKK
ncbi:MAG TPA: serine hydrolase domain-containing protein [Acidobacteriota bacterium]|nr:serine hydrolase domain-containing protein [Acidobacteriota bacterium]